MNSGREFGVSYGRMGDSRNPGGLPYPSFVRTLSGPLGCLALLVLLPIALLTLLFVSFTGLGSARRGARSGSAGAPRQPRTQEEADQEVALCSLVQAMALDEVFSREDAQTAGVMTTAGRTLNEMLDEAIRRGWIETRGEQLAVTGRGRREATGYLRRMDLA